MSQRGFRDAIASYVPKWLSNRLGANFGYRFLFSIMSLFDAEMEAVTQGTFASFPGYGGRTDSLPLIGRSRGLIRGEAETDDAYAARLRVWFDTYVDMGWEETLARLIQTYLGNTPAVTIITRGPDVTTHQAHWTLLDTSGNVTRTTATWDWDSLSSADRNQVSTPDWSDMWVVVSPCEWAVTGTQLTDLVGIWGNEDPATEVGVGHAVPRTALDAILLLCGQAKAAHAFIRCIIWSYDDTWFQPGGDPAKLPDGNWGEWADRNNNYLAARSGIHRYWTPEATN